MIKSVKALSVQNLGSIIALDKSDYKHINDRVKLCISSKGVVEKISETLPPFKQAVVVAELWKSTLFPEIKKSASNLNDYAALSIRDFSKFNEKIKVLDEDADLPTELRLEAISIITSLHINTKPFYERFGELSKGLIIFVEANSDLDNAILNKRLAFQFKVIQENLMNLNIANSHLRGQWQALYDDLGRFLKDINADDITVVLMASLEIEEAIIGWEKLQRECAKFLAEN